MKRLLPMLSLIVVGAACFLGGYRLAQAHEGKKNYASGYEAGKSSVTIPESYFTQFMNLQTEHNQLVNDYNDLLNKAQNYVNTTQYKARQPLSCTSNNLGSFTYTNCH